MLILIHITNSGGHFSIVSRCAEEISLHRDNEKIAGQAETARTDGRGNSVSRLGN